MHSNYYSYVDDLMRNYPIDTDSVNTPESDHSLQNGGQTDAPHGGFPPIYVCNERKELISDTEKDTTRGKTVSVTKGVNIADIMAQRRKMKREYI